MAGTLAPALPPQFFDDDGDPAAAYLLFTYEAGTTTKQATYSDADLTTPNANPIVLDAAGRATVFLDAFSYKFVLAIPTSADPPVGGDVVWTRDEVAAIPAINIDLDIPATAGEDISANDAVYLSDGSGGRTAGSWYKTDADNTYSSTTATALAMAPSAIASGVQGSVRLSGRLTGLSGLVAGALYYVSATAGEITNSAPANVRSIGTADSATSIVIGQWFIPVDASATVAGYVNLSAQTLGDGLKHFKQRPTFNPGVSDSTATAKTVGAIDRNTTQVGNVGGGEDDLMTFTVPADTLDENSALLRVTGRFTLAGGGTKTVKYHFGSASLTLYATTATGTLFAEVEVYRLAATSQLVVGRALTGSGVQAAVETTATEDETAAIVSKFTGQDSGSADDQVIQKAMITEAV